MAEQAILDQEEENLRNRRNTIKRNSTEAIPLSNSISVISNHSNSDSEDDDHTTQSHIANFDPFVDQLQENSSSSHTSVKYNDSEGGSTREESNSDSTETIHIEKNQSQVSMNNSTELFYPSASLLSPSASTATSISGENITSPNINRGSDSEESWDAVSEIEWNQSSANESDNEFSVASISEDDTRIRF